MTTPGTRARAQATKSNRRGSSEAIEKRRVARALNTMFSENKGRSLSDGRTARRRLRLLKELKEGRNGRPLKAIEVMTHADELLRLGEPLDALIDNGVLRENVDLPPDAGDLARRAQAAYDFHPDAWKLLGLSLKSSTRAAVARAVATKSRASRNGRTANKSRKSRA